MWAWIFGDARVGDGPAAEGNALVGDGPEQPTVTNTILSEDGAGVGPAGSDGKVHGDLAAAVDRMATLQQTAMDTARATATAGAARELRRVIQDFRKEALDAASVRGRQLKGAIPLVDEQRVMVPFDLMVDLARMLAGRAEEVELDLYSPATLEAIAAATTALFDTALPPPREPEVTLGVALAVQAVDVIVQAELPVPVIADKVAERSGLREGALTAPQPAAFPGPPALAAEHWLQQVRRCIRRSWTPEVLAALAIRSLVEAGRAKRSSALPEVPEMRVWRESLRTLEGPLDLLMGEGDLLVSADTWERLFPHGTKSSSRPQANVAQAGSHAGGEGGSRAQGCPTCWRKHTGVCINRNHCASCGESGHTYKACPAPLTSPPRSAKNE